MRSSLPTSVALALDDGTGSFSVPGHNLGPDTAAEPADLTQDVLPGYSREVGHGYNVTVHAFDSEANFATLNTWQEDGELVRVTFNFDDGSSVTVRGVGFTVHEETPDQVGSFDGYRLTGFGYGATLPDVLNVSPALPS